MTVEIDPKCPTKRIGQSESSRVDKNTDLFFHPPLFSPFYLSSILTLHSVSLPLPPPLSLFHLMVPEKSQPLHFAFGQSARLSARKSPSLIPLQITLCIHLYLAFLSFTFSQTQTHSRRRGLQLLTMPELKNSKD